MELEKREALKVVYRCSDCNSSNTYYRRSTNDFVCRKCGKVFKVHKSRKRKEA